MSELSSDQLTITHIRPRFEIVTADSITNIEEKLKDALQNENSTCEGSVTAGYATLFPPLKKQHYWSPQLTLSMEEMDDGKSLIRGMYGPKPAVWTLFVFFYTVLALAILIICIIGFSNISLGISGQILWLLPVLIIAFLSLFLVSHFGKKLGKDEIRMLHNFFEKIVSGK
jgi:hypothetical protein